MHCGVARRAINPQVGHPLAGYSSDIFCTGIHDDIAVTALFLSDGHADAILLNLDILCLTGSVEKRVRRAAAQAAGLPIDRIICTTTHTHSGPSIWPQGAPDSGVVQRYLRDLVKTCGQAAAEAKRSAEPCQLRYNYTFVAENMNRRFAFPDRRNLYIPDHKQLIGLSPEFVDRELGVLAFRHTNSTNRYKAVLTNFASHPLCVGNTSSLVSADYQGHLRKLVEESFTGSLCVATTGAAGDNHPLRPEAGFEAARSMGANLAMAAVMRVYDAASAPWDDRLRIARVPIRLRRRDQRTRLLQPAVPDRQPKRDIPEGGAVATEFALLGVGPILLVSVPGELAAELGAVLKWSSLFLRTYVLFQGTDALGYIPTANQYLWGGYEPASSLFAAGEGERLVQAILASAAKLLEKQPLNLPPAARVKTGRFQ